MPRARVNGIELHYEVHGEGLPLLWIGGLGANILETPHLVEAYARHFRFIVFENRGCGRSDKPDGEYSMAGFADDAAGLLDTLQVESAVVYGSSMGGMIAQELALAHPEKVRALILGCTTAGMIRGERPSPEVVQTMIRNQSLAGDEAMEAGWRLGYSDEFIAANRERLLAMGRAAARLAAPRDAYIKQVLASARHDTYDRLSEITCPVMVIHGASDIQIPPGNARLIAERIPHAELRMLEGLGHGYNLEGQAIADALVIEFARRHASVAEGALRAAR
jgi:pimeloyl-ACP methyl ester carboxylesterase